jgi:hypothetical protein
VSRTSRVCVLEGADACCWKASNRLQADPCAIYLSRPHLKQHTCPSHNDSPHPLSRLHQFQVPIFVRHLPNTNSPESPYCNDRLLAVSTPTLLLLRRFLNGSTTSSRTRKCVLYFLLLGLLLRAGMHHTLRDEKSTSIVHDTRPERSREVKHPSRSVVPSQIFLCAMHSLLCKDMQTTTIVL